VVPEAEIEADRGVSVVFKSVTGELERKVMAQIFSWLLTMGKQIGTSLFQASGETQIDDQEVVVAIAVLNLDIRLKMK